MPVWRFEQQWRADSPPPSHPVYYWTSCWYWLQGPGDEPDPDNTSYMVEGMRYFAPRVLTVQDWRVVGPSHVVTYPFGHSENPGLAPFSGPVGTLGVCVLIDLLRAGKRIGYKRLRGWPDNLMRGHRWDDALIAWIRDFAMPNIWPLVPLCNHAGVLIDGFRVRPEIHIWQKRHGGNRSARPVYALPEEVFP